MPDPQSNISIVDTSTTIVTSEGNISGCGSLNRNQNISAHHGPPIYCNRNPEPQRTVHAASTSSTSYLKLNVDEMNLKLEVSPTSVSVNRGRAYHQPVTLSATSFKPFPRIRPFRLWALWWLTPAFLRPPMHIFLLEDA